MSSADPIDTAWRIHSAIADWTGKVDAKASFTLTLESAVLVGVVALSSSGRRLGALSGFWEHVFYFVGVGLLLTGVLMAVWVVRPQLRRRFVAAEAKENFIYFGHLRHWHRDELVEVLQERDLLPILSNQLINMSEIAWQKHMLVRYSLSCAVVGTGLVAIAGVLAG